MQWITESSLALMLRPNVQQWIADEKRWATKLKAIAEADISAHGTFSTFGDVKERLTRFPMELGETGSDAIIGKIVQLANATLSSGVRTKLNILEVTEPYVKAKDLAQALYNRPVGATAVDTICGVFYNCLPPKDAFFRELMHNAGKGLWVSGFCGFRGLRSKTTTMLRKR
jgi:hypothetical protein